MVPPAPPAKNPSYAPVYILIFITINKYLLSNCFQNLYFGLFERISFELYD